MNMHTRKNLTVCRICQNKIRRSFFVINDLIFCREHTCEFKQRQYRGVTTSELNPLWGDTLANWQERPSELSKEVKSKFLATPFMFRQSDQFWLIFERAYYQITLPHKSKPGRTIYNPRKNPSYRLQKQTASPLFHRLPDYIAINKQTGEIRRFINVALNEVSDDLQGIYPAPAQMELAEFWGKRNPGGIRKEMRRRFLRKLQSNQGHSLN